MAKQNLSANITIGGSVARSLTRSITDTRGLMQDVGQEIAQTTNRQRKLSREIAKAEQAGESVAGLRNEYNKLDDQLAKLNKRRNVLSSMTNVGDRFGKMRQEITTLGRRGGIAIGGLAASMGWVTHSTANSNERLNQFSKRLEVSTKWLSRNQYAAQQFGIESDTLADGIKELSLRSDEFAKEGGGEAAEAFKRLGLNQREVNELSKDTEKLYEVVQNRISSVQSVAARQRIADELFGGQAGEQMIELLQVSREEMRKFYNESDATGATITEKQVDMARRYNQQWNQLTSVFGGIRNILGNQLMPVMTDLMGQFSSWVINNRDRVDQFAKTLATQFKAAVPAIMNMVSGIGSVATTLYHITTDVAWLVGGFDNLGMIVGTVFAGKAIASVVGFATAVGGLIGKVASFSSIMLTVTKSVGLVMGALKTLSMFFLTNPIGWAIGAIAGSALLIYKYWEPISGFFKGLWAEVTNAFSEGITGVGRLLVNWSPMGLLYKAFSGVMSWLGVDVPNNLAAAGAKMIGAIASGMKSMAMAPLNAVRAVWSGVEGAFSEGIGGVGRLLVNWSPLGLFYKAFSGVLGWLGVDLPSSLSEAGAKMIGGLASGIKSMAMAPVNAVKDTLSAVREYLPFSDAKKGPMSDLTKSGQAIPKTLAKGVDQGSGAMTGSMNKALAGARPAGGPPATSPAANIDVPAAAPRQQAAGAAGRGSTVNNSYEINLQVSRSEGESEGDYISRLADRLMEEIRDRQEGALFDG